MRRRRWLTLSLVVLMAFVALGVVWPGGPRPCRSTFERVRKGMSFAEVCATVGGPPGVYGGLPVPYITSGPPTLSHEFWYAADSSLYVMFDTETDEAVAVQVDEPRPDYRSLLERIRARVRF